MKKITLSLLLLLPILGISQHKIGFKLKDLKQQYELRRDSVGSYSASDTNGWYTFTFYDNSNIVNVSKFYPYNMKELQAWVKSYDTNLLKVGAYEWEQFWQDGLIKIHLIYHDNRWFFMYFLTDPKEK